MSYKESIVKKAKYKGYFTVDIAKVLNYSVYHHKSNQRTYANTWQDIEKDTFNWNLHECIYSCKFDDLYNSETMVKEAVDYLSNKKNIKVEELENEYIDNIKADIQKACSTAYEHSYVNEAFEWASDKVKESIKKSLDDLDIKAYQILFYSKEDKTLHTEFKYNTTEARIYIPLKELQRIKSEEKIDSIDETIDDLQYNYSVNAINWEYFDYYSSKGNYNDWFEWYKDYNEVEEKIDTKREIFEKVASQSIS
jgi:tRNA(Leu) C34 or U34 (ribose-2'-O)-methylase TrmL